MTPSKKSDHEERIARLESAMQQIAEIAQAVERHEFILKGGDKDGDKGLLERVRNIESSLDSAASWLRAIALLFMAQFVAVIFGVISFFVKIAPALIAMSER